MWTQWKILATHNVAGQSLALLTPHSFMPDTEFMITNICTLYWQCIIVFWQLWMPVKDWTTLLKPWAVGCSEIRAVYCENFLGSWLLQIRITLKPPPPTATTENQALARYLKIMLCFTDFSYNQSDASMHHQRVKKPNQILSVIKKPNSKICANYSS